MLICGYSNILNICKSVYLLVFVGHCSVCYVFVCLFTFVCFCTLKIICRDDLKGRLQCPWQVFSGVSFTFFFSHHICLQCGNQSNSSISRRRYHDVFKKQLEINGWEKWLFRGIFVYFYVLNDFSWTFWKNTICNWLDHVINTFLIWIALRWLCCLLN